MTSLKESGWTVENAAARMKEGTDRLCRQVQRTGLRSDLGKRLSVGN